MTGVVSDLLAVLLPTRCPGCGVVADPVCPGCEASLRRAVPAAPPAPFRAWTSPFAYEGVVRELIARLKYRNERHALGWLAARTAESARRLPAIGSVTHIPTTPDRRRKRGFDHGELLARAVARSLSVPYRPVLRRMAGGAQTGRTAAQRRHGPKLAVVAPVEGVVWLVVDDVATTGATLRAAGRALVAAGGPLPLGATVARTPPPS